MNKATLNLFNAIQVDEKKKTEDILLEETIKHGFVLSPEVAGVVDGHVMSEIMDVIGVSGEKANASFHKSWKIIEDTPQEALWIQAMIHYMTTYGFEALGIYREDAVYIPHEELDIPEITDRIRLIVIHGYTQDEILDKIFDLASGIALKEETLNDIITIIEENKYGAEIIENIKNKELRARLYDLYDVVPAEPVDYLRFLISKVTEESLLIKNDFLIAKIKECETNIHRRALDKALEQAPANLAEIFFRFKPLFLALKSISNNKTFFNQLRKKADTLHKPMPEDFLNSVTSKIKNGEKLLIKDLKAELAKVNIFRKIRLAYALKFRTKENESIVYRVRNGSGFAAEFDFDKYKEAEKYLKTVLKSIEGDLGVGGKTIYIPESINYALPATEKMFTGNFPTGSYVTVPEDMVVGIYWKNTDKRVDLDLSTLSAAGKTGWDSYYTDEGGKVLFSGDVTDAPKGASELFYIKEESTDAKIMMVNYFNHYDGDEVDTKILVASEKPKNFDLDYMVDVNNIIAEATVNINKKQNVLGLIVGVGEENRFYFANVNMGNSISAYGGENSDRAREYFVNFFTDTIDFKELLANAGAEVVTEVPEEGEYIDLSPEALDKTTIINLIQNERKEG